MKSEYLVTRDSLAALIMRDDEVAMHAIGRGLVLLLNRQTEYEQRADRTVSHNKVGFQPQDARRGGITARYYIKHQQLEGWQIEYWTRPIKGRVPRLAKYWRQLNEEAIKKQSRKNERLL